MEDDDIFIFYMIIERTYHRQIGLWLGKPALPVRPGPIGAHAGPNQSKLGGTRSGPARAHTIHAQQRLGKPMLAAERGPIGAHAGPKQTKLSGPRSGPAWAPPFMPSSGRACPLGARPVFCWALLGGLCHTPTKAQEKTEQCPRSPSWACPSKD